MMRFTGSFERTVTEAGPSFPGRSALALRRAGRSPPGSSWRHHAPVGRQVNTLLEHKEIAWFKSS